MTLKQLNEFNYNGFGDDEYEDSHYPNGKKKPTKNKGAEAPTPNPKLIKLEKELSKKQNQLKAVNLKISKSKDESQKYAITNDRKNPLVASIQNLQKEIKGLK